MNAVSPCPVPPVRGDETRNVDASRHSKCPCCGKAFAAEDELVLKRGAIIVAFDPIIVTWRSVPVPLSPVEAALFAHLARRGRATNDELDTVLEEIGASRQTRSLVLGHIRAKFRKLGACDPLERVGNTMYRLCVDADDTGSTGVVIGLRLPRYVKRDSERSREAA